MSLHLSIEVHGQVELDRAFSRFGEGVTDLRDIWPDVAREWRDIELDHFLTDGHGTWPDLSPRYQAWKEEHHPFMPTMRLTQRLFLSLIGRNEDAVEEMSEMELTLGTRVPYATHHRKPYRGRPARDPLDLSEGAKRRLTKSMHRGLVKKAKEIDSGWVQTDITDFD